MENLGRNFFQKVSPHRTHVKNMSAAHLIGKVCRCFLYALYERIHIADNGGYCMGISAEKIVCGMLRFNSQ